MAVIQQGQLAAGATPPARIVPITRLDLGEFTFHNTLLRDGVTNLGPLDMRIAYGSTYVQVPVALSDHIPEEWKANPPTEISCGLHVIAAPNRSVGESVAKLQKFLRKGIGGEPPELALCVGNDVWNVRLQRMEYQPKIWDRSITLVQARFTLMFHTSIGSNNGPAGSGLTWGGAFS